MKKKLLKSLHINERTETLVAFILAIIASMYFFDFPFVQHIDITKYPESVQSCYNENIYSDNSCTKNKRTILKYCECIQGFQAEIDNKKTEANTKLEIAAFHWSTTHLPYSGSTRGFAGETTDIKNRLNAYIKSVYEKCAKKTGYTSCD